LVPFVLVNLPGLVVLVLILIKVSQ